MNISFCNPISFQKKLIAQGGYIQNNESKPCLIYELECGKDRNYMNEVSNSLAWKKATYSENVDYYLSPRFVNYQDTSKIFAIEDCENNCLAFAMLDKFDDAYETSMIEVVPNASSNNKRRTKKYIGETFLNFLAQYTLKEKMPIFNIVYPTKGAYSFYVNKCHFVPLNSLNKLMMDKDSAEKLNIQNELHTGKNIEFLA
ncbi:MAG: hypothetical protein IJW73_09070 [Candidatus Gastranaerophilales bacterium]|nr:hypothetical protein [Candidatus Gastranaerophilales bacterium]